MFQKRLEIIGRIIIKASIPKKYMSSVPIISTHRRKLSRLLNNQKSMDFFYQAKRLWMVKVMYVSLNPMFTLFKLIKVNRLNRVNKINHLFLEMREVSSQCKNDWVLCRHKLVSCFGAQNSPRHSKNKVWTVNGFKQLF